MRAILILFTNPRAVAVVDQFTQTRVGAFLQQRFAERFTKPTQTVFLLLALGFLLSSVRHTVASYLWRSGACPAYGLRIELIGGWKRLLALFFLDRRQQIKILILSKPLFQWLVTVCFIPTEDPACNSW